jgi:succinyl-CoA synthetase beta subunit
MEDDKKLMELSACFPPGLLPLERATELMDTLGISVARYALAEGKAELERVAEAVGFPMVMKVESPDIAHKSDVGGVRVGLQNIDEVKLAHEDMMAAVSQRAPNARVSGVALHEQLSGTELVVGASRDPQFGAVVMVGIGGVTVEVYEDVAFRVAPFGPKEALCAIGELDGQTLLAGFRGSEPVDRDALARVMVAVGNMMVLCEQIAEIDLNPLMGGADGVCAADVRVVVGRHEGVSSGARQGAGAR